MENNTKVETINIIALKDDQGKITGFVLKNGMQVEFYTCETAGTDEIEELLKAISK